MKDFKHGDKVSWKWGSGKASGKVESVRKERTEIQSNGSQVVRNGSKDDPAVILKDNDGNKVLKLASELNKV